MSHQFDSGYASKMDAYQRAKLVKWLGQEDDFGRVREILSKDTLKFTFLH